jgi:hypothetical protein
VQAFAACRLSRLHPVLAPCRSGAAAGDNHGRRTTNQHRHPIIFAASPAVLDPDTAALDLTRFAPCERWRITTVRSGSPKLRCVLDETVQYCTASIVPPCFQRKYSIRCGLSLPLVLAGNVAVATLAWFFVLVDQEIAFASRKTRHEARARTVGDKHLEKPMSTSATRSPQKVVDDVLVDLALQCGGAHGAFSWGVLGRLLEEKRLRIDGISGTSAGAMNAAALADGYTDGGADGARTALESLWSGVARSARFSPFQRGPLDVLLGRRSTIPRCSSQWT